MLWLFTDAQRLPDPFAAVARLPRGAGVVLRDRRDADRLARLCRARGLALVVAGDPRLAARLGAGQHLRDGRLPRTGRAWRKRGALLTSSAHDVPSLRRAARAGAALAFLSPVFPTASHRGAAGLGPARWALLARQAAPLLVAALGGIEGRNARRLPPRFCAGAGAIAALAAEAGVARKPQCFPIAMRSDAGPLRR